MGLWPPEQELGLPSGPQSCSYWAQGRLFPRLAWAHVQQMFMSCGSGLR